MWKEDPWLKAETARETRPIEWGPMGEPDIYTVVSAQCKQNRSAAKMTLPFS